MLASHRAWVHLRIPVPAGHEDEARTVARQLESVSGRH